MIAKSLLQTTDLIATKRNHLSDKIRCQKPKLRKIELSTNTHTHVKTHYRVIGGHMYKYTQIYVVFQR